MEGDFESVLLNPLVIDLLSGNDSYSEGEDIEVYLERRIQTYLSEGTDHSQDNR